MKKRILEKCVLIASQNNHKHTDMEGYHHFSFIIQDNKIIEWGTNRKADPLLCLGYPTYSKMHSEIDAFKKAKGIMNKSKSFEVVNVRLTQRSNRIRTSTPCKCCYAFLKNLGCKQIWFTTNFEAFSCIK